MVPTIPPRKLFKVYPEYFFIVGMSFDSSFARAKEKYPLRVPNLYAHTTHGPFILRQRPGIPVSRRWRCMPGFGPAENHKNGTPRHYINIGRGHSLCCYSDKDFMRTNYWTAFTLSTMCVNYLASNLYLSAGNGRNFNVLQAVCHFFFLFVLRRFLNVIV